MKTREQLTVNTLENIDENVDSLHIPTMETEWLNDGRLQITYDDGNESSWGIEIWCLTDELAILTELQGRDCFDGGIVGDHLMAKFDDKLAIPREGNYDTSGFHPIWISRKEFDELFEREFNGWLESTRQAVNETKDLI